MSHLKDINLLAAPADLIPSPPDFSEQLRIYLASYGDELRSKVKRLELLLEDTHWLSVGTYKESIIRQLLRNKIPTRYEVSTGFVMSRRKRRRVKSDQIDILIWDSNEHSPIFRDGEFVIIPPEACRAAIEVKGNLNAAAFADAFRNLDSLSQFEVGSDYPQENSIHRSIFAFEIDTTFQFPKSIWNSLNSYYQSSKVMSISDRIEHSRNYKECWRATWLNCVAVMSKGVLNCELWEVNDERHVSYVGYKTSQEEKVDTYGFLERSILLDLCLGHERSLSRHQMPGMTAVLFANHAQLLDGPCFMLFPAISGPITKIGRVKPVQELARKLFKPRKPRKLKKSAPLVAN